ncbi:hypothetical protein F5B20DRAFT_539764 [Whalleya microplaca]|nr:hypothetical protein F5B20DRAFT_539764 [Whalleya microplaca]
MNTHAIPCDHLPANMGLSLLLAICLSTAASRLSSATQSSSDKHLSQTERARYLGCLLCYPMLCCAAVAAVVAVCTPGGQRAYMSRASSRALHLYISNTPATTAGSTGWLPACGVHTWLVAAASRERAENLLVWG